MDLIRKNFYYLLIFTVSPVIGIISLVRNRQIEILRIFLVLLFFLFGFNMDFQQILLNGADIIRMVDIFKANIEQHNLNNYSVIYDADKPLEIVFPFITYFVSFLTSDHRAFIGSLGLFYGFFYVNIMFYVLSKINIPSSVLRFIFIANLIFLIHPYQFQAFRFWTATMIVVWSVLPFFFEGSSRRMIFLVVAFLLHNGMAIFIAILLASIAVNIFVGKPFLKLLYYIHIVLFMVFFVTGKEDIPFVSSFVGGGGGSSISEGVNSRASVYLSKDEDVEIVVQEKSWFLVLSGRTLRIAFFLLSIVYFSHLFKTVDYVPLKDKFMLFLCVVADLIMNTEGYRFMVIGYMLFLAFSMIQMNFEEEKSRFIKMVFFLFLLNSFFHTVIEFRIFVEYLSVAIFIMPWFVLYFIEEHLSIYDLYKMFTGGA